MSSRSALTPLNPLRLVLPVPVGVFLLTALALRAGHPRLGDIHVEVAISVATLAALVGVMTMLIDFGWLDVAAVQGGPGDGQRVLVVPWHRPVVSWLRTPTGATPYLLRSGVYRVLAVSTRMRPRRFRRACVCASGVTRLAISCGLTAAVTVGAVVLAPHRPSTAVLLAVATAASSRLAVRSWLDPLSASSRHVLVGAVRCVAVGGPCDGYRWRVRIRSPKRVLLPAGLTLHPYRRSSPSRTRLVVLRRVTYRPERPSVPDDLG